MAARSTWRGAIEVLGFPVSIALYNRVKQTKDLSFKFLSPKDRQPQPMKQVYITQADFEKREAASKPSALKLAVLTQSECARGVPVASGFKRIDANTIEDIRDSERSRLLEPKAFVPVESVPIELARASYVVYPGAPEYKQAVGQLWNGLLEAGMAYTTELTARAGSRDAILVVRATRERLYAEALPFDYELAEVPDVEFERDVKQGKRLAKLIAEDDTPKAEEFDHSIYVSAAQERREKAIKKALAGEEIVKPPEVESKGTEAADLMAALEAEVKARKPKRRTGKRIKSKGAA